MTDQGDQHTAPLLRATDLAKRYPDVAALDGVSLAVAAGEFVAVHGASGCGKSTLLLTLGALLKPDAGSVTLDGNDPFSLSPKARARFRARHIGFVFQDFHLVPYLSVLDNVLAPTLAAPVKHARSRAEMLLGELGLADRRRHLPSELSSGEQQRTALARALLATPVLLLADEPTGNLDRDNADLVLAHLADYAGGGGAVVMVTHDETAMNSAQRRIAMDKGRAVVQE